MLGITCHRSYNYGIIQVERTSGLSPFKQGGMDILYVFSLKLHWQVLWDFSQQKKAWITTTKQKFGSYWGNALSNCQSWALVSRSALCILYLSQAVVHGYSTILENHSEDIPSFSKGRSTRDVQNTRMYQYSTGLHRQQWHR